MRCFGSAWIAFLLTALTAAAQPPRERSALIYTYEGGASIEGGGRLVLRETELRTGYPLVRSEEFVGTIGLRWTRYDFLASGEGLEDFTAHSLRLPLRGVWPRKENWTWMAMVAPAIRSDLESVTSDDFGLSAMALGTYPWRTNWRVSAGAVYSQDFGRSRVFPAVGATWLPSDAWTIDLLFPRPRVAYRVNESLALGVGMEPGGDQWNVDLDGVVRDVALKEYRVGAGFEWAPVRNLAIQGQFGAVIGRELDLRGGGLPRDERDLGDTWYARLGLVFR